MSERRNEQIARSARWALAVWVILLGSVAFSAWRSPIGHSKILHVDRSIYRNLYVVQEGPLRCLTFGKADSRQSCLDPRDPDRLIFDYTRATMAALYLVPAPQRILIVGLGGGAMPRAFQQAVPGVNVDVVELDPGVVAAARRYFDYQEGGNVITYTQDARLFVRNQALKNIRYDLIVMDAFDKDYIPEHLLTREFFIQVRQVLAPGGMIAANTFASSALIEHERATYQAVFGDLMEVSVDSGNRILLARPNGLPSLFDIEKRANELDGVLTRIGAGSAFLLPKIHRLPKATARVLTDQYSPANLLQNL